MESNNRVNVDHLQISSSCDFGNIVCGEKVNPSSCEKNLLLLSKCVNWGFKDISLISGRKLCSSLHSTFTNASWKNLSKRTTKLPICDTRGSIEKDLNYLHKLALESTTDMEEPLPKETQKLISKLDDYCFFDEVRGRFRSDSDDEADDSFQIVFSDSPPQNKKLERTRMASDCESEDSFIVFEDDTKDSCYTTTDVFGDESTDSEESDEESSDSEDSMSDSGHAKSNLEGLSSGNMMRTVSDLTNESVFGDEASQESYGEDEVDCAFALHREECIPGGVLLNKARKRAKRMLPSKKVRFSEAPPVIHVMRVWAFAARQARVGRWEQHTIDRHRFKRRIDDVDAAISWVLKPQHRSVVKFQRFMPWWNAQRRLEEAQQKEEREEEEQRKRQEEADALNNTDAEEITKEEEVGELNTTGDSKLTKDTVAH